MVLALTTQQASFAQNARLDSLIQVLPTIQDDSLLIETHLRIVRLLPDSAHGQKTAHMLKAESLAEELGDDAMLAQVYIGSAEYLRGLDNARTAIEYAQRAYQKFELLQDTAGMARTEVTLALLNMDLRQYEQATEFLDLAESRYRSIGAKRGPIIARHNKASAYSSMEMHEEALQIYRENLLLIDPEQGLDLLAVTHNNMGNTFLDIKNADSALYYLDIALTEKQQLEKESGRKNPYLLARTVTNLGRAYKLKHSFVLARKYFTWGDTLASFAGSPVLLYENLQPWAELEYEAGNYQESAKLFRQALQFHTSIYDTEMNSMAIKAQAGFKAERDRSNQKLLLKNEQLKNSQDELLKKSDELIASRATRDRWLIVASLSVLTLMGGLLVWLVLRNRDRKRNELMLLDKNQKIERQKEDMVLINQQLSLQNQRLQELHEEKDGIMHVVAHDIRSPLNRSAALADLVAQLGPLTDDQVKYLNMIKKVTDDGGRMIQDMLDMTVYEKEDYQIKSEQLEIRSFLESALETWQLAAQKKNIGIELETDVPAELRIDTDERLLHRVLDNLVSNALKFSDADSHVRLQASVDGIRLRLAVKDQGPGIREEELPKLFQKFQRLSARPTAGEPSSGLGLSIVRTLTQRLNGAVEVDSTFGLGTTFTVSLPLHS